MPSVERIVELPDGDRLLLHDSQPEGWHDGRPIVLLVHGLIGSHDSGYMRRTARALLPHGVRVARMNLRGAGAGMTLARRSYHAGCSDDVRAAANHICREAPNSPLWLAGFSLGGNIVLKLAGEASENPLPGLARVAAVAPPIDLARCATLLAQPRNRFYERHFVVELLALVRQRRRHFPHLRKLHLPPRISLREFDERYTALQAGFSGAADYYQRASSMPYVSRIAVPTLILTASDDPFVAVEPFRLLPPRELVDVQIVPGGGHLGFLGRDGAGGIRWAERRVVRWLVASGV
jgi:predicted alpha/beta-fold hydrolase